MMPLRLVLGLALLWPFVLPGQEIKTDFQSGSDGWGCSNAFVEHRASGGNPGAFLFVDNNEIGVVLCSAPPKFLGNLLAFNGGTFSFDGNLILEGARYWTEEEAVPFGGNYGTVRITGGGGSVSKDLKIGKPAQGSWNTYPIGMTASAWGVSEAQWLAILGNVTSIEINLEALFGEEQEGLDNVVLRGTISTLSIEEPETLYDSPVGKFWSTRSHGAGGTPPYTWSFEGTLPTGIEMRPQYASPTSMLWNGGLTQEGTFNFSFVVTDAKGDKASRSYQVTVAPPSNPVLTLKSNDKYVFGVPDDEIWVQVGEPLEKGFDTKYRLSASEGVPRYQYSWDFQGGSINLAPESGQIFGTVPKGEYSTETTIPVVAQVRDSEGRTTTRNLAIRIFFSPEITDPSQLPDGRVGQAYEFQCHRRYGGDPSSIYWAPDPTGSYPLPPGLMIDRGTGLITGTPTEAGDYEIFVYVSNKAFPIGGGGFLNLKVLPAGPASEPGPKLNTSRISCDAVQQGAPGSTAPVTSTGGDQGLDASGAAPWLKAPAPVPPTPGSPRPSFNTLECDPAGLPPGQHQTEVKVDGKPVKVDFHISEPNPVIEYAPERLDIRVPKLARSLMKTRIRLSFGRLNETHIVKVDLPKIAGNTSGTVSLRGRTPLTITSEIDSKDVPAGAHTVTSVRAQVAGVGIASIPLNIYATSQSAAEVRPLGFVSTFANRTGTDRRTIFLTNPTGNPMEWQTASQGPANATVTPASGTLAPGATQVLTVNVSPPPGGARVASGSIEVKAGNSTRGIGFTAMESPAGMRLRISPATASFFTPFMFRDREEAPLQPALRTAGQPANVGPMLAATLSNLSNSGRSFLCYVPPGSGFVLAPTSGMLAAGASISLNITAAQPAKGIAEADAVCQVGEAVTRLHLTAFAPNSGCVANRLLLQPETPSPNLSMDVGKTYPVQTEVLGSCGNVVEDAFVTVGDGYRSVVLSHVGGGLYAGEWTPQSPGSRPLTLTATAGPLAGEARLYPIVLPDTDRQPRLERAAPRGAASFGVNFTPTTGSLITLFGSDLADEVLEAPNIPLPATLAGVTVTLGGRPMPLLFASPNQINALVLYDLPKFVPLELVVQRGALRSAPLTVTLGDAAPDLFTFIEGETTRAIVLDLDFQLITSAHRLKRGSVGVLLASGLGDVAPELGPNQQTASNIRIATGSVSVQIGGLDAPISFSGLLSGFAGAYQINFLVPEGVTPGTNPVVLTVNGKSSNLVITEIE